MSEDVKTPRSLYGIKIDTEQIIDNQAVPGIDSTDNILERDPIGNKVDAAQGVPGNEYSNISMLKGLLTDRQVKMLTALTDKVTAIAYSGTYIFAAIDTSPAQVLKIDPLTMLVVATWTGAAGQNHPTCLQYTSGRLYVGLNTGDVVQISPLSMATLLTWVGGLGAVRSLAFNGANIFAGLATTPGQIIKINTATMTTVSTWTGAAGENNVYALMYDYASGWLIAGLYISPAKVIKIDYTTMTTSAIWTGGALQNLCDALTFDGEYYYAGLYTTPAYIVKIVPATMVTDSLWTGSSDSVRRLTGLCFDGNHIIGSLYDAFSNAVKINPADMSLVTLWKATDFGIYTVLRESPVLCVTTNGEFIWLGIDDVQGRILRVRIPSLNTLDTVDLLLKINSSKINWVEETWQTIYLEDHKPDPRIWSVIDPSTANTWGLFIYDGSPMMMSIPAAAQTARLGMLLLFVNPASTLSPSTKMIDRLLIEWEMIFANVANIDSTLAFYGLGASYASNRGFDDIAGFAITAGALQTVTDLGGTESTNTGFGETLTNRNIFGIQISSGAVDFYLNKVRIARHTTNLPTKPLYPVVSHIAAGGATTIRLGTLRVGNRIRSL